MKTTIKILAFFFMASVAVATPRFIFTFVKTNATAEVQSNFVADVEGDTGIRGLSLNTLSNMTIMVSVSDSNDVRWAIGIDRTKPNSPNAPLTVTDGEIWTWTNASVNVILGENSDAITNSYQVGP
jgi:hypothetical protein